MSDTQKAGPEPVRMRQPSPEEIAMMKASQERAVVEQKKARLIGVTATIFSGYMANPEDDRDTEDAVDSCLDAALMIISKTENLFSEKGN